MLLQEGNFFGQDTFSVAVESNEDVTAEVRAALAEEVREKAARKFQRWWESWWLGWVEIKQENRMGML